MQPRSRFEARGPNLFVAKGFDGICERGAARDRHRAVRRVREAPDDDHGVTDLDGRDHAGAHPAANSDPAWIRVIHGQ